MTPSRWNVAGWLMLAVCVAALAALYVLLLVTVPVVGGLLTSHALLALVVWWLTGHNLRAELEGVSVRKDTAIDAAMDTAFQVQELEQHISGEQPAVDPEPPSWMDQSGYRPPRHKENEDYPEWFLNGEESPFVDCPEEGGCRRPEQCESGCYWLRLGELNRPLIEDEDFLKTISPQESRDLGGAP